MTDPVRTGDDLLAVLASLPRYKWRAELMFQPMPVLREAADLCGVADADVLGKVGLIKGISSNF